MVLSHGSLKRHVITKTEITELVIIHGEAKQSSETLSYINAKYYITVYFI